MFFVFIILPLFLGCKSKDSGSPSESISDTGLMELGMIQGNVSRSVDCVGDCIGSLVVLAYFNMMPSLTISTQKILALDSVDFSDPDAAIPYTLTHFFPEPYPYYVIALFDDDNSLISGSGLMPTAGDLITEQFDSGSFEPFLITSGAVIDVDLELSIQYED